MTPSIKIDGTEYRMSDKSFALICENAEERERLDPITFDPDHPFTIICERTGDRAYADDHLSALRAARTLREDANPHDVQGWSRSPIHILYEGKHLITYAKEQAL